MSKQIRLLHPSPDIARPLQLLVNETDVTVHSNVPRRLLSSKYMKSKSSSYSLVYTLECFLNGWNSRVQWR